MSKLREIRNKKAISIYELHEKSGVSVASISRIENGRKPRHITKRKIAQALDMKPEDIEF